MKSAIDRKACSKRRILAKNSDGKLGKLGSGVVSHMGMESSVRSEG